MTEFTRNAPGVTTEAFASLDRRRFLALSATASLAAVVGSPARAQQAAENPVLAPGWTAADIPDQTGRIVVITGGNGAPKTIAPGTFPPPGVYSGLGFQQARALAGKGADVIIASRNAANASEAISVIKAEHPAAKIRFEQFDLADLASVTAFSDRLKSQVDHIDVLINNGGTAGTSDRRLNGAGLELVWATNVVGHFSLTAQLFPLLQKGSSPRLVIMGSGAARRSTGFDDMQTETGYTPMTAYVTSKAALLILARDLHRRSEASGWGINITATQPGTAKTFMPTSLGPDSEVGKTLGKEPDRFRPAERAVLSVLYAAAHPDAKSGGYYGPVNEQYDIGNSDDHVRKLDTPETAARLYEALTRATGQTIG
jgi:NAD(P)-dependent dehydrogenase (short-subunit alcohol dehydrogenase family)